LTSLNLSYNKIKNIDELGESLKFNSFLTYLFLNSNKNIENIYKLNKSLKSNSSLTLKYNKKKRK